MRRNGLGRCGSPCAANPPPRPLLACLHARGARHLRAQHAVGRARTSIPPVEPVQRQLEPDCIGHSRDSGDLGERITPDRSGTASTSGRRPSTADAAANGGRDGAETGPGTKRAMRQALLAQLQEARQRSSQLQSSLRLGGPPQPVFDPAAHVDRKVYEQLAASRQRLAKQLSERNRAISGLEQQLSAKDERLRQVLGAFSHVGEGMTVLRRLADNALASVTYGLDRKGDQERVNALAKRLEQLQQAHAHALAGLGACVPREVPVAWYGMASEVRLMGDFDGWSRGYDLSAEDIGGNIFTRFEAMVPLLPGEHRVKFLVDGSWRLAPDLPEETTEGGERNNVLLVL